jgi:hypothetical protein
VFQPVVLSGTNFRVVVAVFLRIFAAFRSDRKQKAESGLQPSAEKRGRRREEVFGVKSGARSKTRRGYRRWHLAPGNGYRVSLLVSSRRTPGGIEQVLAEDLKLQMGSVERGCLEEMRISEKLTATDRVVERRKEQAEKGFGWMQRRLCPTYKRSAISRLASLPPMTWEEGARWEPEGDRGFEEEVE